MSSPARQVRVRPAAKPRARTAPLPKPAPGRPHKPALPPRQPEAAHRSRGGPAESGVPVFYVSAVALLLAMVFGLASLNAVLAQGAFRVEELSKQQILLEQQNGELRRSIDDLSSPARLTTAASQAGLVLPDTNDIQVVHAGAAPDSDKPSRRELRAAAAADDSAGATNALGHRSQAGRPATSGAAPDLPGGPE